MADITTKQTNINHGQYSVDVDDSSHLSNLPDCYKTSPSNDSSRPTDAKAADIAQVLLRLESLLLQCIAAEEQLPVDISNSGSPTTPSTVAHKENIPILSVVEFDSDESAQHSCHSHSHNGAELQGFKQEVQPDNTCSPLLSIPRQYIELCKHIAFKYFSELKAEEKNDLRLLEDMMSSYQDDDTGTCLSCAVLSSFYHLNIFRICLHAKPQCFSI